MFLISYIRIITGVRSFFENLGRRQIGCAAASAEIRRDSICTIKWMFGIPDVLDFLRSRKIKEGSTVQVIQRINGGLILGMDGKRIAMCDAAADRIQV